MAFRGTPASCAGSGDGVGVQHVSSLYLALPTGGGLSAHSAAIGLSPPEWVHLIPAGTFRGRDGRGPYHVKDADALIAASMAEGNLALDENHATDHAAVSGISSPARGWIVAMQSRADGIWGQIEWTESGAAMMSDKAYRGISPVYSHAKDGTLTRILRAALTNTPNLAQLATLHAEGGDAGRTVSGTSEGHRMDIAVVRHALGLPETADEAACLVAMTERTGTVATQSAQIEALSRTMVPVADVVALQAQVSTLTNERALEKATAFVDAAIAAGKPIVPARAQMIAQHAADPGKTEEMINLLPSIHTPGVVVSTQAQRDGGGKFSGGDGTEAMSDEDTAVCAKMGIEPKAFAEWKKKQREEKA
jgi:phage I-like protein